MTLHILRLVLLCLLGLPVDLFAQEQKADPDFDAKVAKPAYTDKHPSVIIDEAHNNFHTARGRYKPFADLIAADGYTIKQGIAPFTDKTLAGHDVLVISNARPADTNIEPGADIPSAFKEDEIDAVEQWVSNGGSMLLIADHAPFGVAAKALAKKFGVDMSGGFTTDSKNCDPTGGPSILVFSTDNQLLGEHAITKGRDASESLKKVTTFTGQSLKGPEGAVAFLKLSDTAEDATRPNDPKKTSAKGRAQGIAFKHGKGRVVVMGEAAVLSAQVIQRGNEILRKVGMNYSGSDNRQLALNIMHWLSGLMD